jgi:two-component system NtrC family sensor kinase
VSSCQQNEVERLHQEVAQLKAKLTQTQRLTALGELVSTTTHEFNNVLMTIINYAKMGMRHDDKETRDKAFSKIHQAGNRAAKITNSVLGMARNRSENFEQTNLPALIEQSMVLLEREMLKYRIDVEIEIEQGLPEVNAIGNQIQQVLVNLLINARQAMSEGGRLIIRLLHNPGTDMVEICVRDFGQGIPERCLRKIFDPYFTTKSGPDDSGKGGTGIGLSTCKNIIEAHGGKIRVESSVGKGTCFTLFLPVSRPVTAPIPKGLNNPCTASTSAANGLSH